ncbi:MAG: hypothetical protein ACK5PR_03230, partial [bacterium]
CAPLSQTLSHAPNSPACASLRKPNPKELLDESDHSQQNQITSVASLRKTDRNREMHDRFQMKTVIGMVKLRTNVKHYESLMAPTTSGMDMRGCYLVPMLSARNLSCCVIASYSLQLAVRRSGDLGGRTLWGHTSECRIDRLALKSTVAHPGMVMWRAWYAIVSGWIRADQSTNCRGSTLECDRSSFYVVLGSNGKTRTTHVHTWCAVVFHKRCILSAATVT